MDLVLSWITQHMFQIFATFVLGLCAGVGEAADWSPRDSDTEANMIFKRFDFNFRIWTMSLFGALACWVVILWGWNPSTGFISEIASKNNFWLWLSQLVSILLVIFSIPARHLWGAVMFILGTGLFMAVAKLVIVTSFGLG